MTPSSTLHREWERERRKLRKNKYFIHEKLCVDEEFRSWRWRHLEKSRKSLSLARSYRFSRTFSLTLSFLTPAWSEMAGCDKCVNLIHDEMDWQREKNRTWLSALMTSQRIKLSRIKRARCSRQWRSRLLLSSSLKHKRFSLELRWELIHWQRLRQSDNLRNPHSESMGTENEAWKLSLWESRAYRACSHSFSPYAHMTSFAPRIDWISSLSLSWLFLPSWKFHDTELEWRKEEKEWKCAGIRLRMCAEQLSAVEDSPLSRIDFVKGTELKNPSC